MKTGFKELQDNLVRGHQQGGEPGRIWAKGNLVGLSADGYLSSLNL